MLVVRHAIHRYFGIPKVIIHLMMLDLCIQLINAAFTILLNFDMLDHGFKDYEIASMVGNRYLTVMLCSVPLAIWAKGKHLKPFMLAGAISAPIVALLLIYAIHIHNSELIRVLMSLWGITFSLVQVLIMPYVLLNGSHEHETESIALFFSAGNITTIIVGVFNYILPSLHPFFTNQNLLIIYSTIGLGGIYFITKLPNTEKLSARVPFGNIHTDYNWNLIFKAAVPTFIIALGAGFTIPVINLFFHDVHGMQAPAFSLMNAVAFTLVALGALLVPEIKRRFGYQVAITLVQSLAVLLLFTMATTEWYNHTAIGLIVAAVTYTLRQPLMNMALQCLVLKLPLARILLLIYYILKQGLIKWVVCHFN